MRSLASLHSLLALSALVVVVTGAEVATDDSTAPEDDPDSGWSSWSDWSLCSRTCDGGAAVQTRRCLHYAGCRGDSVRYKLCNVEPCPEGSRDFRAVQCSEYDGLPHNGASYEWEPAEGNDPCALTCRAKGGGPVVTLNPRVQDGTRCTPGSLDLCINGRCQKVGCDLVLGSQREVDKCGVCGGDGSSCNKPSYNWNKRASGSCSASCGGGYQMLSAVCEEESSGRRVSEDLCDPSSRPVPAILTCNPHACPTTWQTGEWGTCSVSCGSGGYQLREVFCAEPRNTSVVRVADHNCAPPRPRHRRGCNPHKCPRWYDGIWSECSTTCGDGVQTRVVLCRDAEGRSSQQCEDALRPTNTRPCRIGVACPLPSTLAHPRHQPYTPPWWPEEQDALASEEGPAPLLPRPQAFLGGQQVPSEPTFINGNWSSCSVTCGEGVRTRSVTCKIFLEFSRTVAELPKKQCPGVRPPDTQRCVMPPCPDAMTRHESPDGEVSDAAHHRPVIKLEDEDEDMDESSSRDRRIHETPFLPRLVNEDEEDMDGALKTPKSKSSNLDTEVPQAQAYNDPHPGLHSYEAPGDTKPRGDPVLLYPGEYTSIDLFDSLEVPHGSKSYSATPQHKDMNSIEIDVRRRNEEYPGYYHVTDEDDAGPHTYKWTTLGFGLCSASCLGGVQESVVKCIRTSDKKIVQPQLCDSQVRPDVITRTCNDQPCPPRWNISEFGPCNKPCGGGIQRRDVKCIHEVTRGGTNTVEVPDSLCPQPPHRAIQHCNYVDCLPEWVAGSWSNCSASCGGGVKTRTLQCQQIRAQGQSEERPAEECPSVKPRIVRKCNQRACRMGRGNAKKAVIKSQDYQDFVQSNLSNKLTLKVGGKAAVFRGVKLKVKCPVRNFNRSLISWWRHGRRVGKRGPIRTTPRGVLKIREVRFPDAGVYVCQAGDLEANITLVVKPTSQANESSGGQFPSHGRSPNEVSPGRQFVRGSAHSSAAEWPVRKTKSNKGSRGRRRKGRRRNKGTKGKGHRGSQGQGSIESETAHQDAMPPHSQLEPFREGPFKASSKNMHTVEVSSSEATNTYDTPLWRSTTKQDYVYGTVNHGWPLTGRPHHSSTAKGTREERPPVYGTVNLHSNTSRITSEENQIVYGTVRHNMLPGTEHSRRRKWDEGTHIFEHHPPSSSWSRPRLGSQSHFSHGDTQSPGHDTDRRPNPTSDSTPTVHSTSTTSTTTTTSTTPDHHGHQHHNHHNHHHHHNNHHLHRIPTGTPQRRHEVSLSLTPAPPNTSSGGSRTVPPFQKLLSNLESFLPASLQGTISSRGARHMDSPMDEFNNRMSSHGFVQDDNTTRDPHGKGDILGKGTRDSLEFEWQMTNWSECSQTCGFTSSSSGYQVRSIQCLARVKNVTSPVDGALCVDAGLEAPVTIQRCGFTECPQWHFGEWSECESSRCFTLHYAYQRREVVCKLHNGTIVSNLQCDNRTRPRHRQECYNYQCSGVWRVGDWSECTAPCGGQGYRTRLLQCVWNGTKKAAGNACRELPRPEVVRWCNGDPCPDLSEDDSQEVKGCRDRSKYCNIVKRMNMCRIQSYQRQCCRSCPP
ncbi:protein madd-4-like isoform X4 [Portunus trituberculatus]|uniref:protein madd-4-like isoform X4 n=1 Tax=Portunus trituberculatus TaxID=210409 RepID=UPI001E1D041F|nr:protein madd-4-like isoform X4 [Portunus trituberculatus]